MTLPAPAATAAACSAAATRGPCVAGGVAGRPSLSGTRSSKGSISCAMAAILSCARTTCRHCAHWHTRWQGWCNQILSAGITGRSCSMHCTSEAYHRAKNLHSGRCCQGGRPAEVVQQKAPKNSTACKLKYQPGSGSSNRQLCYAGCSASRIYLTSQSPGQTPGFPICPACAWARSHVSRPLPTAQLHLLRWTQCRSVAKVKPMLAGFSTDSKSSHGHALGMCMQSRLPQVLLDGAGHSQDKDLRPRLSRRGTSRS